MIVWLVMQEDGNVCCPAEVLRAVCSTKEIAERFIAANPSSDEQHVVELAMDEYAGGAR